MIDINFVNPTGGLVKSVNGKTGKVVLTAYDVAGAVTEEYVSAKIAEAKLDGVGVDLTAYATKEYVAKKINEIDIPEVEVDLTNYYTKNETDYAINAAIEGLEIPEAEVDLTNYYTKEEVDTKFDNLVIPEGGEVNLENYYTKSEVNALIPDVSGYALKTEIPDVSGYTTMSAVEGKGYQTADQVNALITTAIGKITDADGVNY